MRRKPNMAFILKISLLTANRGWRNSFSLHTNKCITILHTYKWPRPQSESAASRLKANLQKNKALLLMCAHPQRRAEIVLFFFNPVNDESDLLWAHLYTHTAYWWSFGCNVVASSHRMVGVWCEKPCCCGLRSVWTGFLTLTAGRHGVCRARWAWNYN